MTDLIAPSSEICYYQKTRYRSQAKPYTFRSKKQISMRKPTEAVLKMENNSEGLIISLNLHLATFAQAFASLSL